MQEKDQQTLGIPGAIVLGSALIAAAMYFGMANMFTGGPIEAPGSNIPVTETSTPTLPAPSRAPASTDPVDVGAGDLPTLGDPNAPVLLVEFSDFQCPFCGRFFSQVEPELIKQYVDTGKVRFAYRDFAFLGQESRDAANAARCANEQGKFWEYHDVLFNSQDGENRGTFSKENLKSFGAALGLNVSAFNACVDSDKHIDAVDADIAIARSVGVSGTPTTFINGRVVNGAQPFTTFQTVIEDELNKK